MRKRPPCGTALGYQSHLRHGEASCLPCREAHTERQRQRRAQIITCRECGQQAGQWARNRCVRCYERRRRDLARVASADQPTESE